MYIKKSFISGIITALGVFILILMMLVFSFTEVQIPEYIWLTGWIGSILAIVRTVTKLERV